MKKTIDTCSIWIVRIIVVGVIALTGMMILPMPAHAQYYPPSNYNPAAVAITGGTVNGVAIGELFGASAGIIEQRDGTNPQTWELDNTWTSASNREYLSIGWMPTTNVASILTQSIGSGSSRALTIGTAGLSPLNLQVNGGIRWIVNTASFNPSTDAAYDIGALTFHIRNQYQSGIYVNNATVIATPATGTTVTIAASTNLQLITPAGTLAALTITLPTALADGDTREITLANTVTSLSYTGAQVGGITTCATYCTEKFRWVAANTSWYRIP